MNLVRTAVQVLKYENAVEMMKKIDFSPLNKIVSDIVGKNVEFQYKVSKPNKNEHPVVTIFSETDVKENTGFLKNCFEKVLVRDFGATLYTVFEFDKDLVDYYVEQGDFDSANNVSQKIINSYLDLYLDARIYLKSGVENGLNILHGKFDLDKGEWKF